MYQKKIIIREKAWENMFKAKIFHPFNIEDGIRNGSRNRKRK